MMDIQSECEVIPRDFLCCKLCDEEYKHPKYLVCFHSFCKQCVQKYMQEHQAERSFWCPICGTETVLRENQENDLPDNLLVQRLVCPTINENKRDKICTICKNGGNFIDSKNFCIQCNEFLCRECTDLHLQQADTEDHKLETIEEHFVRTDYEESAKSGKVVPRCCSYYDPLDIGALFCVDCDIAVCGDCHLSYHEEHRCAEMVAVAENFQNKIKQPLEELQNDATNLQEAIMSLQKAEVSTIEQQKDMHRIVKKRSKYLYDLISQYENVLLEEIDRRHTQNLDDIHQSRKDLQMHLAAIDGVSDFSKNLLSYGSFEEKVFMRKKVGKRVRELCEEELLTESLNPPLITLSEPNIAIETICNMFGELKIGENQLSTSSPAVTSDNNRPTPEQGIADSVSESELIKTNEQEYMVNESAQTDTDSDNLEAATNGSDVKMRTLSNTSSDIRNEKLDEKSVKTEDVADNCVTLENPIRELTLPQTILQECMKGIGVNKYGDIIVGASAANYQMVYLLEKRGILRGQFPVQNGWNIHSVASDGKVALTVARGDNRYKVKIMKNDGSGKIMTNTQIDHFGLNFVTADECGNLIVASNRYSHVTNFGKITSKAGGNISLYDQNGILKRRITNEDYQDLGMYILEKPHCIAVDNKVGNFYVADPGNHNVTGFDSSGELLFEYGNSDNEAQIYDGPDLVCVDDSGDIFVADKRMHKVDVLSNKGELKRSLYTDDIIKYMAVTPDNLLMLATGEGTIKFFEYRNS